MQELQAIQHWILEFHSVLRCRWFGERQGKWYGLPFCSDGALQTASDAEREERRVDAVKHDAESSGPGVDESIHSQHRLNALLRVDVNGDEISQMFRNRPNSF